MTKNEWTSSEVLAEAAEVSDYGGTQAGLMLTAYANRIEADESAVPVAWVYIDQGGMRRLAFERNAFATDNAPLVHPPAQAAQVDSSKLDHASARAFALLCSALVSDDAFAITHQSMGQYRTSLIAKLDGLIAECKPTAEPVAQVDETSAIGYRGDVCDHGRGMDETCNEQGCSRDYAPAKPVAQGDALPEDFGLSHKWDGKKWIREATHTHSPDAVDSGRVTDEMVCTATDAANQVGAFSCTGTIREVAMHAALEAALAAQGQSAAHSSEVPDWWVDINESQPDRNKPAIYWHTSNHGGFPAIADEWRDEHHRNRASHWLPFAAPSPAKGAAHE